MYCTRCVKSEVSLALRVWSLKLVNDLLIFGRKQLHVLLCSPIYVAPKLQQMLSHSRFLVCSTWGFPTVGNITYIQSSDISYILYTEIDHKLTRQSYIGCLHSVGLPGPTMQPDPGREITQQGYTFQSHECGTYNVRVYPQLC